MTPVSPGNNGVEKFLVILNLLEKGFCCIGTLFITIQMMLKARIEWFKAGPWRQIFYTLFGNKLEQYIR